MKKIVAVICCLLYLHSNAQTKTENNTELIKKARTEIMPAFEYFFSDCLVNKDCNECVEELVSKPTDAYQTYLVGGALYAISPKKSYALHKAAFEKKPQERNFNLEYAIESHRIGDYTTAIKHYKVYKEVVPEDYRVDVWLSECYLNTDNYKKAITHWKAANHEKNHIGIDKAIYVIRGDTLQLQKRSKLISQLKTKDEKSAYELVFLDMNWELDWWNSNIQEYFLAKDMETIKTTFGEESKVYKQLETYEKVKKLSKDYNSKEAIKTALLDAQLILENNEIPKHGNIASDLLRIIFLNKLADEEVFFNARGKEIIQLADANKDVELLNIYAYLEATVTGKVTAETDKKGWGEYKSEKFAISYFIGLADKNTYDNPDLAKALLDFPNSSKIHWVKLNCAVIEGKDVKEDLIAVLKKEFKTLGSDPSKFSYGLKGYFHLLENEMK